MEQLSLRELQLLVEAQYTVKDSRKDLGQMVEFFRSLPQQREWVEVAFCKERRLPMQTAEEHGVFFCPDDFRVIDLPEEFRPEALGMVKGNHVTYAGRLVYPVKDVLGDVMGFCGWDKFVQPKYLDSKNHGYKAKRTTVYGMERMGQYYVSQEPVYVMEGIVCALYLRSKGYQALALLGSSIPEYVAVMLRRFGRRLVLIPDNDAIGKCGAELGNLSGEHLVRQAKKLLPEALVVQSRIAKDIDDSRKVEGMENALLQEVGSVVRNPYLPLDLLRVR